MTRPTAQTTASQPPPDDASASEDPPRSLHVDVMIEGGDWSSFEPLEHLVLAAAAAVEHAHRARVVGRMAATIALSTDRHVQDLNRDFRHKDSATNVLSFPSAGASEPVAPNYIGDIILACETVSRESHDLQIPPPHHLQHLVVHGLLHLLGFDHEADDEATAMEALETEILAGLGIDDPYADTELVSPPAQFPNSEERLDRK